MKLVVTGLNHRTAPVELRERYSLSLEQRQALLQQLRADLGLDEVVVLSTCNRLEVYGVTERLAVPARRLFRAISRIKGRDDDDDQIESCLYQHEDDACVHHLFRVASSLDSLVVGETEIVGQVKKAYQQAQDAGATGKILNRLFQSALSLSKKVRTRSGIGRCSTSVGAVAVDLAVQIFGEDLENRAVLIIGAGKMGETTLRHLVKHGARSIIVANRSVERARELAAEFNGQAVPFADLHRVLAQADVVISSTGAPYQVLFKRDVAQVMAQRQNRPLFLIDLAVPRDIDGAVQELGGTYLYNIDQLADLSRHNLARRQTEAAACETMVADHARDVAARFTPPSAPHPESRHLPAPAAACPGLLLTA